MQRGALGGAGSGRPAGRVHSTRPPRVASPAAAASARPPFGLARQDEAPGPHRVPAAPSRQSPAAVAGMRSRVNRPLPGGKGASRPPLGIGNGEFRPWFRRHRHHRPERRDRPRLRERVFAREQPEACRWAGSRRRTCHARAPSSVRMRAQSRLPCRAADACTSLRLKGRAAIRRTAPRDRTRPAPATAPARYSNRRAFARNGLPACQQASTRSRP